jgi:serine/threonine protein kinase
MTPPREPDDAGQTLLPDEPGHAPEDHPPADHPPAERSGDTPPHPGAADATVNVPELPALVADPAATLPTDARPERAAPVGHAGGAMRRDIEATLLPDQLADADATAVSGVTGGDTPSPADAGATLVAPAARSDVSGGSHGPLGSDTAPASVSAGPGGAARPSPSATGTMVGRFALKDLHAAGGLGEVFKARDTELNREVAVKRIKSHYADDPGSRRRFLTEAELTAKLDHPGVVPVFGLVNDVRGRPCYAMRFIRGETLKDEIDRYHKRPTGDAKPETEKTDESAAPAPEPAGDAAAPPPAPAAAVPRSVAFRHLLGRFIATCQAIAYAHSRHIIHRDIKPANVMVGTFGETLVVDWGLAKSMDDGPDFDRVMKAASAAGFRRDPEATDLPSHVTLAGTAVGTPAYMSPEQAAGDVERVGPAADVYALGATLYVILTGRAPFGGKTTAEVLALVRQGAYRPAADVNPDCPRPLDAVARKAMALRPEDRYATALDLAADVERWLSDEPVSCYRDPLPARLARWARRHPARVAAGVSLLLAGALAAAGVAWAVHAGEQRTAAANVQLKEERDKVEAANVRLKEERDKVEAQEKKTAAALVQVKEEEARTRQQRAIAVARYEKAVDAYTVLINDVDKQFAKRAGMQDLRESLLANSIKGLDQLIQGGGGQSGADRTLVAAYRQMGDVYQMLGETAKAWVRYDAATKLARAVRDESRKGTAAERRAADLDLGRSLCRLAAAHLTAVESKAALAAADEAIALLAPLAADAADAEAQAALADARQLRAKILRERGDTGGAIRASEDALAATKALHDRTPAAAEPKRDYAAALDALAALQLRTGRTKDALAGAERALGLRKELAGQFPAEPDVTRELAAAYARLGEVTAERGQPTAAAGWFGEGVRVLTELSAADPRSVLPRADLAALYGQLAQVQLRTGDVTEAVANAATGKRLAQELRAADENSADARRGLAQAAELYGEALLALGDTAAALKEFEAGKALRDRLSAADAGSARAKLDLARGLERLGDGCAAGRDAAGALAAYAECVRMRREAAATDPASASARRDLAVGLYKLADAHCLAGKSGAADAPATEATDLLVKLAKDDPDSAQAQRDVALAYGKWGQVLAAGGHATGALLVWQSSLGRCEKLAQVDALNVQAKEDEAAAWERLAGFYAARGQTDMALAATRRVVELWTAIGQASAKTKAGSRRLALALIRCGDVSVESRQFRAARDWYAQAEQALGATAGDPLLEPVAKRVREQREYLEAVETLLGRPAGAEQVPARVRAAALRAVATLELRADHPTGAASAATYLAKYAASADDAFAAARALAGVAARTKEPVRTEYANDAVAQLRVAIAWGFRDADALAEPEWDTVRARAPDFPKARAELEKLRNGGK